jgi:hypothetical protein
MSGRGPTSRSIAQRLPPDELFFLAGARNRGRFPGVAPCRHGRPRITVRGCPGHPRGHEGNTFRHLALGTGKEVTMQHSADLCTRIRPCCRPNRVDGRDEPGHDAAPLVRRFAPVTGAPHKQLITLDSAKGIQENRNRQRALDNWRRQPHGLIPSRRSGQALRSDAQVRVGLILRSDAQQRVSKDGPARSLVGAPWSVLPDAALRAAPYTKVPIIERLRSSTSARNFRTQWVGARRWPTQDEGGLGIKVNPTNSRRNRRPVSPATSIRRRRASKNTNTIRNEFEAGTARDVPNP